MTWLVVSFLAGVVTVLAPCVLPFLPVVLGVSAGSRRALTPFVVVGSLAVSIFIFTLLLKVSSAFIAVPSVVWTTLSGGILCVYGLLVVFPQLWEKLATRFSLMPRAQKLLSTGYKQNHYAGDALMGLALGPIFSTCSPTYFVILASVLPASYALGTLYLLVYIAGVVLVLLLVAIVGQALATRLTFFSDTHGWWRRGLGMVFLVIGLAVVTGYDKVIEKNLLQHGYFDSSTLEYRLLEYIP